MKIVLAGISTAALLALSACAEPAEESTDTAMADAPMADTAPAAPAMTEETDGDSISLSEDGVTAEINDGDTSVNAEISDDPSLTVED